MRSRTARRLVAGLLFASMLAACGGGGGGGGGAVGQAGSDPVATVNALVATVQAKAFDKLPDLACAASKDTISSAIDPSVGATAALGVTGAEFLDAINIEWQNLKVDPASVTGDTATVHVKADMKVTANQDKLKELIKKMLTAAGQPASDAMVNAALAGMGSAFDKATPVDTTIPLKNEGGKWLLCGDLSNLTN